MLPLCRDCLQWSPQHIRTFMNINFLLSIFAPKDKKFLPLLEETSDIMVKAASMLDELFTLDDRQKAVDCCKRIKAEESRGDKVTGLIHKALYENFITPFDREDIDALADEMDDCIDAINRAAQKVLLYSPRRHADCSVAMIAIIKQGIEQVHGAIKGLRELKKSDPKLRQYYREIKRLEEEGDVLYEKAIMALFREETDTIELIKQKEIIQELEKTVNRVNKIGKILKTIFIKYA